MLPDIEDLHERKLAKLPYSLPEGEALLHHCRKQLAHEGLWFLNVLSLARHLMLALRILAAPTPGHQEAVKVPATDALHESGAAAHAYV